MSVAVFAFISFMLLVRSLDPVIYGEWVLFIVLGNFVEMLRFGVTRTAIIRFLSGANKIDRIKLLGSNWYIGLIATIIISIVKIQLVFVTVNVNKWISVF